MLRKAADDFLNGRETEVHKFVSVDEAAILNKVKFNDVMARERALAGIDIEDVRRVVKEKYDEKVTAIAIRVGDKIFPGVPGEVHFDTIERITEENPELVGLTKQQMAELTPDRFNELLYDEQVLFESGFITDKGKFVDREEAVKLLKLGPDRKAAGVEDLPEAHSSDLPETDFFSRLEIIKAIEDERQARVNDFIEAERRSWDEEGRLKVARREEIERQVAEGKTLTPKQVEEFGFETKESAQPVLTEQEGDLMRQVEAMEQELTIKEKEQLKELDSHAKGTKASIDAAVNCLIDPRI
jgi:hypothetical protein